MGTALPALPNASDVRQTTANSRVSPMPAVRIRASGRRNASAFIPRDAGRQSGAGACLWAFAGCEGYAFLQFGPIRRIGRFGWAFPHANREPSKGPAESGG